uniref:Uncharacterized protein n=1 Tax=Phytophthora ramorum TaxID=164328 RepID=H3H4M3_PHYRM
LWEPLWLAARRSPLLNRATAAALHALDASGEDASGTPSATSGSAGASVTVPRSPAATPLAAGEGAEGSSPPTPPSSPGSSLVLAYLLGATPTVVSTPPESPATHSISVGCQTDPTDGDLPRSAQAEPSEPSSIERQLLQLGHLVVGVARQRPRRVDSVLDSRLESATDLGEILSAAVAPARLSLAESEEIISLRDEIARLQAHRSSSSESSEDSPDAAMDSGGETKAPTEGSAGVGDDSDESDDLPLIPSVSRRRRDRRKRLRQRSSSPSLLSKSALPAGKRLGRPSVNLRARAQGGPSGASGSTPVSSPVSGSTPTPSPSLSAGPSPGSPAHTPAPDSSVPPSSAEVVDLSGEEVVTEAPVAAVPASGPFSSPVITPPRHDGRPSRSASVLANLRSMKALETLEASDDFILGSGQSSEDPQALKTPVAPTSGGVIAPGPVSGVVPSPAVLVTSVSPPVSAPPSVSSALTPETPVGSAVGAPETSAASASHVFRRLGL